MNHTALPATEAPLSEIALRVSRSRRCVARTRCPCRLSQHQRVALVDCRRHVGADGVAGSARKQRGATELYSHRMDVNAVHKKEYDIGLLTRLQCFRRLCSPGSRIRLTQRKRNVPEPKVGSKTPMPSVRLCPRI